MLQAQWLKITEKVSFINASKASYIYYIMSGQKFIKSANWKPEIETVKCDILGDFQTHVMLLLCATIVANAARL